MGNVGRITFDSVDDLTEYEPGYLLGTLYVFGAPHHIEFYRVVLGENESGGQTQRVWVPDDDEEAGQNDQRYEALMSLVNCGPLQTVKIPGREGEYVCLVVPYEG